MRTKRFNFATVLCAFFAAAFLSVGVVMASPVKAADVTNEADQAVFVMDEGASIRVGTDDSTYGVKFTAMMTDANYQKLMAKVGEGKEYASVTFGMLIAPASYSTHYGELNYENVFGADAKYDWRTFNTETGEWNAYTSNKTQIINIYGQKLYEVNPVEGEKYWAFQGGAVTKVSSTLLKYQGVGYVELVKADDTKDYIFAVANDNARTAYDVALKALQDTNSGLTEDEIAWIEENYIASTAQDAKFDLGMTNAETIDLAKLGIPAGEYEITAQQYIQKAAGMETLGAAVTVPTLSEGTVLDVSGLDGIFTINVNYTGTEYGYTIDLERYTPGEFVWNNVMDVEKSVYVSGSYKNLEAVTVTNENVLVTEGDKKTGDYYKVTYEKGKIFSSGIKIYPVHSKEYYTTFYTGATIDVDYLWARSSLVESNGSSANGHLVENGTSDNDRFIRFYKFYKIGWNETCDHTQAPDTWGSSRKAISLSTVLANWDTLLSATEGALFKSNYATENASASVSSSNKDNGYSGEYVIYFGNVHVTNPSAASYKVEAYNAVTGELLQEETVSNVALGSTVPTITPATIDGYVFDEDNQNNVLTGKVDGFGSLTLKAYYLPCEDISVDETGAALLRSDATLDFGDIGTIKKYTVTQYVVKTTKVDKTTQKPTAWTQYDVDVTEDYANKFTGSVLDTSTFDGIYTVTAYGTKSIKSIKFEQIKLKEDGTTVFTWNNIIENGHDEIVGAELIGSVHELASSYTYRSYKGSATISVETTKTDAKLATMTEGVKSNTLYWKISNIPASEAKGSASEVRNGKPFIRVYPVHSYEYYQGFMDNNTNLAVQYGFFTDTNEAPVTVRPWNATYGQSVSGSGLSTNGQAQERTIYAASSKTMYFNNQVYVRLSAIAGSGVSRLGSLCGVYSWSKSEDYSSTMTDMYVTNPYIYVS